MATTNDELIAILNNLIETCRDGQEGFRTAAESSVRSDLKSLFSNYSQQRAQFAGELQQEVRTLGGDPEKSGSVAGSLHRGWMNIRAAVLGHEEAAIVSECERGEDASVSNYGDAIGKEMPANIRAIVEKQYSEVQAAHDLIRSLQLAASKTA